MRTRPRVLTAAAAVAVLVFASGCSSDPPVGSAAPRAAVGVAGLDAATLAVMDKRAYARGRWSISVRDVDTGETLVDVDADKLGAPGSVRTYAAGAAWLDLGPDQRITTPVVRSGEIVDGVLAGDLVLVARGDVTMGNRARSDGTVEIADVDVDHDDANAVPGAALTPADPLAGLDLLAGQVRAAGITRVSGRVEIDDRLFRTRTLAGLPVSPIVINDNLIDLVTTPTEPGEPAAVAMRPAVAPWTVDRAVVTVAAGEKTAVEVSSPVDGRIALTGTIAADHGPVLNVHGFADPATFARTAFIEALERAGVAVAADPLAANSTAALPPAVTVEDLPAVAALVSPTLDQRATYVLKVASVRGAATMLCLLAVAAGSADCDDGPASAAAVWSRAGLDPEGAVVVDGSGLDGDLVTAGSATEVMTILARRPDAARWRSTLPVLGVDGPLATVQRDNPARGRVVAEPGALVGIDRFNDRLRQSRSLVGYIRSAKDRNLAFAIIVDNATFEDPEGLAAANDDLGQIAASFQQAY
jgi:D-alanyl-D-alanine carboxypeptidase/D-alanyl-D-alanine-endopeptidase (penicillin-binding protein 4)